MIDRKKTKTMIFNFTEKYQFGIKLKIGGTPIEIIDITQLLGTIIEKIQMGPKWPKQNQLQN